MYNRNLVIIGIYLFTIYLHSTNGDAYDSETLHVHTKSYKWEEGFDKCGSIGAFGGAQLFNYCQPETCNASKAKNKIDNPLRGHQQYWINGYVLRSPVLFNKGCFSLERSKKDAFHEGNFSFDDNSPFTCSRECPEATYIFLRAKECLCISEKNYILMASCYNEESMSECNIDCAGREFDKCGNDSYNEKTDTYSVYKIVNKDTSKRDFTETCKSIYLDGNKAVFTFDHCWNNHQSFCQYYNTTSKTYETTCINNTVGWLDAQKECQIKGQQLFNDVTRPKCMKGTSKFWIGQHLQEKIVWGNKGSVPKDALCLTLVIDSDIESDQYKLETKECNKRFDFLCSRVHTENEDEGSGVTTFEDEGSGVTTLSSNTGVKTPTVDSQITGKPRTKSIVPNQENNLVPVVAGVVGGLVLTIIIVIIIVLVRRKRSSACQEKSFVPTRSYDYSEPRVNYSSEEQNKLINVTEEGVYNHLGDTDKITETKSASSVYDIMGKAENEYDISEATGKRQNIDEKNDLYDHSRGDELYDSTTENPTRKSTRFKRL